MKETLIQQIGHALLEAKQSSSAPYAANEAVIPWEQTKKSIRGKVPQPPQNISALSSEETRRMLYELEVQQIELEMQNEELRRIQAALETVRNQYFNHYELAPVGYFTLSTQNLLVEVNCTGAIMLGVNRDQLTLQRFSNFILAEDQDTYYFFRKQLLESNEPQQCELRLLGMDQAAFWGHLHGTTSQGRDGTFFFLSPRSHRHLRA